MLYHSKRKREIRAERRIRARYDLSGRPTPFEKTRQLLRAKPEWGPILRTCIVITKQRKGKFAGAWIVQALNAKGITPPNNLRTLTSIGLLKMDSTTRGGNRAYYQIPALKEVAKALESLGF